MKYDWENDKQKAIERLKYLLSMRENEPKRYSKCRYGIEKEEIYIRFGNEIKNMHTVDMGSIF